MSPLRDAVRLIDGEEFDAGAGESGGEGGVGEALRGDVEELGLAVDEGLVAPVLLRAIEVGVDERGGDADGLERFDLILHERDEGRDDDGAADLECGEDVADALAAAGGHDGEDIALVEGGEDVGLAIAEVWESEDVVEACSIVVEGGQGGAWCGHCRSGG